MRQIHIVIVLTCLALTTACGSLNEDSLGSKAFEHLGTVTGLREAPITAPAVPTQALAAGPGHVVMATLLGRNAVAAMTRVGVNGNVETWRTAKGVTLSFQNDILISSRGLEEDLMGADVANARTAIGQGSGEIQRRHAYLDSEDQITLQVLNCTVINEGRDVITTVGGQQDTIKVSEDCTGSRLIFKNTYWLDTLGGNIVQSHQALGPVVGFVKVNPL